MSIDRLGRQVTGLPAPHGGEEGGKVGQLRRPGAVPLCRVLDLLPLTIEERPAGAIAGEVAAFAVDEDALVLISEFAILARPCASLKLRTSQIIGAGR